MGKEIDLLMKYPKAKRDLKKRSLQKSEEDRRIARKFGKNFFDGDRRHGYGGFSYNKRFWSEVVIDFKNYYNLNPKSSILDVGSAKGFMLYDFMNLIPGMDVRGIDISKYAIENTIEPVKPFVEVADAKKLPFDDDSFDLVISINTIHNLNEHDCGLAIKEINRVSKDNSFITVDAYRNDEEKRMMYDWNLTAKTIKHVDDWVEFFNTLNYKGDYFWFMP